MVSPELEHSDIELAEASRVSNDIEPPDLVVPEGEGQCSGLHRKKLGINAFGAQQFLMAADLSDATVIDHDDAIGRLDGEKNRWEIRTRPGSERFRLDSYSK